MQASDCCALKVSAETSRKLKPLRTIKITPKPVQNSTRPFRTIANVTPTAPPKASAAARNRSPRAPPSRGRPSHPSRRAQGKPIGEKRRSGFVNADEKRNQFENDENRAI